MNARNFFDRKKELVDWLNELNDEHLLEQISKLKESNPTRNKKIKIEEDLKSEHWL